MRIIVLALLVLTLAGCASRGSAEISFRKANTPASVRNAFENFPAAYITSNRDGEYDVLLVNDTLRTAATGGHKKPLRPVAEPPLQQAVHIHVFWRPTNGAMVHESSITNAIVHWYVFNPDGAQGNDMLHYEGAAFVKLNAKGNIASVTIGDGEIAPKEARGSLKDPVGASRITGYVSAVRNDARVKELLASLQDKVAGNDRYWTEARTDDASPFSK